MKLKFNLTNKLMLLLAVIIVICQMMMSGWFVWQTRAALNDAHNKHLAQLKVSISRTIALDVWNFNEESLTLLLAPYRNDPAIERMVVRSSDGRHELIVHSDQSHQQSQQWLLLKPARFVESIMLPVGQVDTLVGELELIGTTGYIQNQLLVSLQRQLTELLILLVMMAIGLWLSFRKLVIQPLHKLKHSLDDAAFSKDGVLSNPLRGLADEYEDVAQSIVLLSERLASDVRTIKETNQELQQAKEQTERALQELKNAQAALLLSEKQAALTSLVAGVAHEMNTPLGIIITGASCIGEEVRGLSDGLRSNLLTKSEFNQHLQIISQAIDLIEKNGAKADSLIRNFKQLASVQGDGSMRLFDLVAYLQDVLLAAQHQWPAIEFQTHFEAEILIKGEPGLFHQLLWALLENVAVHAYPEPSNGVCELSLTLVHGEVHLQCRDHGVGIESDALSRVFDPFFTTRLGTGSNGLGLSIAYRIVTNNLKGHISLASQPAHGCCVSIVIPQAL